MCDYIHRKHVVIGKQRQPHLDLFLQHFLRIRAHPGKSEQSGNKIADCGGSGEKKKR